MGDKSFAIIDLDYEKQATQFEESEKLDFVILHSADWQNCHRIQELHTRRTIISNTFGSKMKERIQESAPTSSIMFTSETGMLEL